MSWWSKMRWEKVGSVRFLDGAGEYVGVCNGSKHFLFPAVNDDNDTGWVLIACRDCDKIVVAGWWEQFNMVPTEVMEEEVPLHIISQAAEMITW